MHAFHSRTEMGNLLIAKGLTVTRWIGFSEGSSPLPMENVPPGIETISGISWAVVGAVAGAGDAPSLALSCGLAFSCGACAGADTEAFPFGCSAGAGAGDALS